MDSYSASVAVVVDLPHHSGLGGALSYRHATPLEPGTLVQVPLGRREVLGIVWEASALQDAPADPGTCKPVTAVLDVPPLGAPWRSLLTFAADYYRRGLGELALSVLPPELRKATPAALARRGARLAKAQARKGAPPRTAIDPASSQLPGDQADATPNPPPLTPEQAAVLQALQEATSPTGRASTAPTAPVLLHGVTGSGKTEVYLHAAQAVIARCKANGEAAQVLILVPEINLTPQLEANVRARFPQLNIVTLHSQLAEGERLRHADLA